MRTMKHLAIAAMSASALALAACGGGGSGGSPSAAGSGPRTDVDLASLGDLSGYMPAAGTYQIAANGSLILGGVEFSCAVSACTVYVHNDGEVTSRGGTVTAGLSMALDELRKAEANVARLTGDLATANQDLMDTQADLNDANGDITTLTAARDAAQADVTRLTGELGTANADVTRLTGELADANGDVTRLTGELADANGDVTRLTGELADANGDVTRLTGELADANGDVTRLTGELADANGEVTRLEGELATARDNSADEAEIARLEMELADAQAMIGSMDDDPSEAEGASLYAQLNAKIAMIGSADDADSLLGQIAGLEAMIGSMEDSEGTSLYAQLNAKIAEIGSADDPDSLMGKIAGLEAMIGMMDDEASEAEGASLYAQLNAKIAMIGSADDADSLMGRIAGLEAMIGMPDDEASEAEGASLYAQLNAKIAMIGSADEADSLMGQIASLTAERDKYKQMVADAEEQRQTEEEKARMAAETATAAKLFAAISPASGDGSTEADTARFAEITPVAADDPTPFISVNYGGELETENQANSATLNLDKDTPVADHRGWKGNRYVEKDADGNVITEARVYSDEMPTMGKKFGGTAANDEFEYALVNGMVTVDGTDDDNAPRVGGSRFDQSAGVKEFALPDPNPSGATMVTVPGTFHGVSGTYSCTPTNDNTCAANKAPTGFILGLTLDSSNAFTADATAWTFKPTNANAKVTDASDSMYAVYGWWLRKPAGNGAWTASAFADYYGTPDTISALDDLNGSATYTGGAAGKYALSSTTGGTNEAGHFTARATLEADFDTEMISGTIDQFMSDGAAKNWSVALQKSGFNAAGQILGAAGADDSTPMKTVWTKDGTAAAASGHWKGNFREVGDNGVPKVVTGDFYSEFGNSGKMVGGFGAKTE